VRRAALTLLEQAILSGTNFLTTVLIGRMCLQHELGLYSMGFSLMLLFSGLSWSLFGLPYTIYSPRRRGERLARYTGSVTVHVGVFCLVTAVGLAAASAVIGQTSGLADLSGLLAALVIAGTFILFREFLRRVYLANLQVGRAMVLNAGLAVLQLGGLLALARYGVLSAVTAYWAIGLACGLLSLVWLFVERRRLKIRPGQIRLDWIRNWKTGRWVFSASLVRVAGRDIYPWLLALFHGPSSVGVLAAASGVVFFANPVMIGVWNFFTPLAAHTYAEEGAQGLKRTVRRGTLGLLAVVFVFCAAISIWGGDLVVFLYGPQYAGQGAVVRSLALRLLAEAACLPVGLGLLAQGRADYELKTAVIQAVVMVTLGLWFVHRFGAAGVGYAATAAYLATAAVMWIAFRRLVRHA
jgi:O-antigen/teichoic acid export membrane protein